MFVRVSVAAKLVEKKGEVIQVIPTVPFVPRLLVVIDCGRVFDDGSVVVVGLPFGGGEPSQD